MCINVKYWNSMRKTGTRLIENIQRKFMDAEICVLNIKYLRSVRETGTTW